MARGGRLLIAAAVVAAVTLSACGSSDDSGDGSGTVAGGAKPVNVVASTNVYGDIAERIGANRVSVTSIIKDPSQDPHSYEADTRTRLAISKADVVIKNGGGYDDFVTTLAKGTDATVLDAVTISGKKAPAGGELNEHVWYDFPSMRKLADRIAATLIKADPVSRSTYRTNALTFDTQLRNLERVEAGIAAKYAGSGVAITEPVPLYLLTAAGLSNKTPAEFSEAVEEGDDVPVGVLNRTLNLFEAGTVKLLAYNEQTAGTETERVKAAAQQNKVPVVDFTETLPDDRTYLSWMTANLAAVKAALGG